MKDESVENARVVALRNLISDLGMSDLSQEKQSELVAKFSESLLKRIFLESMERIGQDGRDEYEKLSQGDFSAEQLETFFSEKIEDYDRMVENVIEEFKAELTASNKQ